MECYCNYNCNNAFISVWPSGLSFYSHTCIPLGLILNFLTETDWLMDQHSFGWLNICVCVYVGLKDKEGHGLMNCTEGDPSWSHLLCPTTSPDTDLAIKRTLANDFSITTCCLSDPIYTSFPHISMYQRPNYSNNFHYSNMFTLIPTASIYSVFTLKIS